MVEPMRPDLTEAATAFSSSVGNIMHIMQNPHAMPSMRIGVSAWKSQSDST
jgi:hypothetical protein